MTEFKIAGFKCKCGIEIISVRKAGKLMAGPPTTRGLNHKFIHLCRERLLTGVLSEGQGGRDHWGFYSIT